MTPLVLELPFPPSVNSIWRSRCGINGKPMFYLDRQYQAWKLECDGVFWTMFPKPMPFSGPVKVDITLDKTRKKGDADNRQKAVNDWLQRALIVANDRQIEDTRSHWGTAPTGCRVVVEAIP